MSKNDNGWAEYGGYMPAKIQKLNQQFNENKTEISDIFHGISIFINGYTNPPDYKLRELMKQHGGKCYQYYSKDVTHIIANILPKSKVDKLTNEKIVTPGWITDSVNAGRLIEWSDYQLYSDRYKSNQEMMKSFVKQDNGHELDTGAISISEYYSKSRLHHLSTWANDLNIYLQNLKNQSSEDFISFPGRSEFLDYFESCTDKKLQTVNEPLMMHIDMDCFFASVGVRDRPDLVGQPVVVTHSSKASSSGAAGDNSMAAVASCSYEARKFGIKNGMLLGKAKTLCPQLFAINYQFDQYLEVSKTLYRTMVRFTHEIEVGSCDELYVNLMDILKMPHIPTSANETTIISPLVFADYIRTIIKSETKCPSSCGIGSNLLACKLATKRAKPAGSFWLKSSEVEASIRDVSVRDMPGIGRVSEEKLNGMSVATFGDLQKVPIQRLQSTFGVKTAKKLYNNCRGKDDRLLKVDKQRKSISAEINYGIRLRSWRDCEEFFRKFSIEMANRMKQAEVKGSQLTLKVMIRHPEASVESAKYLGHGVCDNHSKSIRCPTATNDHTDIYKYAIDLFRTLNKQVEDLRGVGLVMHRLQPDNLVDGDRNKDNKIERFFIKKPITQSPRSKDGDDDCVITTESLIDSKIDCTNLAADGEDAKENRPTATGDAKVKRYLATLGMTALDKLKSAIVDWVQSEDVPMEEDLVLMRDQIVSMVPERVVVVHELLLLLRGEIDLRGKGLGGDQPWWDCYENIVQRAQEACFDLFGEYIELD